MTHKHLEIAAILAACLAVACGGKGRPSGDADAGDTEGDAEAEQDVPADTPEDDASGDPVEEDGPPPPEETYCMACTWDRDCGPGGECALLADGKLSCLPACAGFECPSGSTCTARLDGVERCAPNTGECVWDGLGSDCPSWGCSGRERLCTVPSGGGGYCTHECTSRADCEAGMNRCADRGDGTPVCLEDLPSPFERCGETEHPDGVGSPCSSPTCSDPVFVCSDTIVSTLPAFCTRTCSSDTECGEGTCVVLQGTAGPGRHCVPDECSCLGVVPDSMMETALEATGLARCDLGWPKELVTPSDPEFRHDRFRLPWFDDVHSDWLRGGVPLATDLETRFDSAVSAGYGQAIVEAADLSGHPIPAGTVTYTPDATEPLVMAVAGVLETLGETPDLAALRADAADVPTDLQRAAAIVLISAGEAIEARERALAPTIGGDDSEVEAYFLRTPGFALPMSGASLSATDPRTQAFLIDDFGYEEMYQAAYRLAQAVDQAGFDTLAPTGTFAFDQATSAGRIIISDGSDTTYDGTLAGEDILLVVDAGGSDTYRASVGANRTVANPVSVAIDLDGTDLYAYVEVPNPRDGTRLVSDDGGRYSSPPFTLSNRPRQGAGRLGIGMLFDLGSDSDTYRSLRMSQGFGSLGVGLSWDDGGDDDRACEAGCQGAGIWGLGILVDRGTGTDTYASYHQSQGFAYVGAVGLLHDEGGPDGYLCNQDDVLYPSAQDTASNFSGCQGMGFGRRADIGLGGDGVFMSGGLGIIRDLGGDDTYEAAIFALGAGYWFALGALLDGGGSDTYAGRWYVLGAAAHYANGLLHDASGNDHYNEYEDRRLNMTLGSGHDFSNGVLLDDSGDDVYYSPNLSLGTANDNGFGLLLDRGGIDSYDCSSGFSYGNALAVRFAPLSVGLFLEAAGADTYHRPDSTLLVNDTLWLQTVSGASVEHGVGLDSSTLVPGI